MAQQGKAYSPEERESIIESLKPYLEMGFSRRKACAFIGFDDTTLSKWVQDDVALSIKLTSWENLNNALALANVHQALQNEKILTTEKGEVRVENSWKLISKLEDGYKDKIDVTSNDKTVTVGGFTFVKNGNDNTEDNAN